MWFRHFPSYERSEVESERRVAVLAASSATFSGDGQSVACTRGDRIELYAFPVLRPWGRIIRLAFLVALLFALTGTYFECRRALMAKLKSTKLFGLLAREIK